MKTQKLWKGLVVAIVAFGIPMTAVAATFETNERYVLGSTEVVEGDAYVFSANPVVSGTVNGDLVIFGGTVTVDGTIAQDLLVAGGTVNITGEVRDDIRAAGGTLTINGTIGGDVVVAGGTVIIGPAAVVGGDLRAAGGQVQVEGQVKGVTKIYNDEGNVRGEHFKRAVDNIFSVFGFLMQAICTIIFVAIFRNLSRSMAFEGVTNFGYSLLRGFIIALVLFIGGLAVMVTIVGIPFGFLSLSVLIVWAILSSILYPVWVGAVLAYLFKKKESVSTSMLVLMGLLGVIVLEFLPILGALATVIGSLTMIGVFGKRWHDMVWKNR